MKDDEEAELIKNKEEALLITEEELHLREKEDKHRYPSIQFPD